MKGWLINRAMTRWRRLAHHVLSSLPQLPQSRRQPVATLFCAPFCAPFGASIYALLCALLCVGSPQSAHGQPAHAVNLADGRTVPKSGVVVLATYLVSPAKLARLQHYANEAGLKMQVLHVATTSAPALKDAAEQAGLLVIDAPHTSVVQDAVARYGAVLRDLHTPRVVIGELGSTAAIEWSGGARAGIAPRDIERDGDGARAQTLREYWRFGGSRNLRNAVLMMQAWVDGRDSVFAVPQRPPSSGVYHPALPDLAADPEAILNLPPAANQKAVSAGMRAGEGASRPPIVAIAVHAAVLVSEDTRWLDQLIAALAARGLSAYAFYGPRQQKDLYWQMTHIHGRRLADLLINASYVFNPTDRKAELERIGVPVLQTLPALSINASQWAAGSEGLPLADVANYLTTSELAGMVDPLLITARNAASGTTEPIAAQIAALADKAAAYVALQRSPAAERRLAMLVYNYPAGEKNFGASFLNVPRSLEIMLGALRAAGYRNDAPDAATLTTAIQATLAAFHRDGVLERLLDEDLAEQLPLKDYENWLRSLPPEARTRIEAYWGRAEKSSMLRPLRGQPGERGFVIPRVKLGNVSVLPQPPRHERGEGVQRKLFHRSKVPLSHSYLATYLWIRQGMGAHALVHLGTHGTQEWAPGKERGLSVTDDPMLAVGALPVIYPYIVDNLGEALTAKRRGRAVLISHSTPAFSPAGFRPGVHEMHDLMHDWETVAPGPVRQEIEVRLTAQFVENQFHRDLGWSQERIRSGFAEFMEVLHPYLDEIAQTAQPLGLASFGETPSAQRRVLTILQTLRKPLIEALGEDIDEVFLLDAAKLAQSRPARWLKAALTDPQAASVLDLRRESRGEPVSLVPNRAQEKAIDQVALLALAQRAQQLERALSGNLEITNFLAALEGRHIAASYGGDPVRNPESLPTGRNLYGFDPSRVPTRQAWEAGVAAFKVWMQQHRTEHGGKWPSKIAFTLWAGETMRHQGVMEAQALYALGVTPRWDEAGRIVGVEAIRREVLARPRLDVVLSVTGSYRDQFPTVMRWLDAGVRLAAATDEPDNAVAVNTRQLRQGFLKAGMPAAEAGRWAAARVFSNESGDYGTGLSEAALASDTWQRGDGKLAQLYLDRMGFATAQEQQGGQGGGQEGTQTAGTRTSAQRQAYAHNLRQVEAAVLSRTSNTYGVLTSDDPFQYLGGIGLAVRELTGKAPALYVQNLRDQSEIRTDSAASAVAKEMQTRYLHPQWIVAQQAEGYSGTLQVLKTAQFLWGWQVTAPETVRPDHWQSLHDVYVRDRYQIGTRRWLEKDNQQAFAQTLERMIDAIRQGYWQPDADTRRELMESYRNAAETAKLPNRNAAVEQFVRSQMAKPVQTERANDPAARKDARPTPAPARDPESAPESTSEYASAETVRGLKLEPQALPPAVLEVVGAGLAIGVALLMLLLILIGAMREARRTRPA